MWYDPEVEAKLRKHIEKKLEKRNEVITHLAFYLGMNAVLWMIYYAVNGSFSSDMPWALLVTVIWGLGLVAHFFDYYNSYGAGRERHERTVNREMERELQKLYGVREKTKHDDLFFEEGYSHLSDDDADHLNQSR